jgi:hypothetical protein
MIMAWTLKDNIPPEPASVTDLIDGDLDEVTKLDLTAKGLRCLPDDLERLRNLRILDVSANELETLPNRLGELAELRSLHIFRNNLIALPASIGQCTHLAFLDVDGNPIRTLPVELAQLTALEGLDISRTQITTLPPGLEKLPIRRLALSRLPDNADSILPHWPVNDLTFRKSAAEQITATIALLPAVTRLRLFDNHLTTWPQALNTLNLVSLEIWGGIALGFPDLRVFPTLQVVELRYCNINSIPDWVGSLSNLTSLELSRNKITTLPRQLADLGDDLKLDLSGNPLAPPLDELAKQGTPALFAYLRSLTEDAAPDPVETVPTVPEQQTAPLSVEVEQGRLRVRPEAGTIEALRREFATMFGLVRKRAVEAAQAIGGNHVKMAGLLRDYLSYLGETPEQLQGIALGFTGQDITIQAAHCRDEDGTDQLSQDQRASLEILLAAHELLMRSVPEWQDYVLKTGQRPPLSDEIAMLVRTLSQGIVVDMRQRPKEIDKAVADRLQDLTDLADQSPPDQRHLTRWGLSDGLGNLLSALAKEALLTGKEIPNEARKLTARGIIGLGAAAACIMLSHAPELLALAQLLPGYGWISQVIVALRAMAEK